MVSAARGALKINLLIWLAFVNLSLGTTASMSAQETSGVGNTGDAASRVELNVDVVFVLDNSGSMISNDPRFITREVVTDFLKHLRGRFRVGMVLFDKDASLIEPLSDPGAVAGRERFLQSLEAITYQGQYTNTPAGVERAIYELKSNGREAAEKIIILLTDGIVDTGNKELDAAGEEWLKEQLALACKQAGIRVFGIAFTEAADFRLIQTLALKTGGEYFRTFSSAEIPSVFNKIEKILAEPKVAPAESAPAAEPKPVPIIIQQQVSSPDPAADEQRSPGPMPLLLTGLILIVLIVVVLIYLNRKREAPGGMTIQPGQVDPLDSQSQNPPEGQAELIDADNVISETRLSLPIDKQVVKIGRDRSNDIVIPQDAISSLHATIEYRNGYYYLEDQRSTNGTRLNGVAVKENTPMRLKSGDTIQLAVYAFRFLMPEMAPYGETVVVRRETDPSADG